MVDVLLVVVWFVATVGGVLYLVRDETSNCWLRCRDWKDTLWADNTASRVCLKCGRFQIKRDGKWCDARPTDQGEV